MLFLVCCCWLAFVVCFLLLVVSCLLFVVCCLLFVVCFLLFVVCCLFLVVCFLLFVVCCLLLASSVTSPGLGRLLVVLGHNSSCNSSGNNTFVQKETTIMTNLRLTSNQQTNKQQQ